MQLDAAADAFYNERIKEVSVTQWVQRRIPVLLLGRGLTAARASQWRDQFLAAGQAGLKSRAPDARDEEHQRLHAWIDASMAGVRGLSSWGLLQWFVDARIRRPNPLRGSMV